MQGSTTKAHILNFVVLTAASLVYDSGIYCCFIEADAWEEDAERRW